MDLYDLVPSLRRQLSQYLKNTHTDEVLAAYLADGVDALNWRWSRTYEITHDSTTNPDTYTVEPTIAARDKRPIILMASIIFKSANIDLARFSDGDFAYDPSQGRYNPLATDITELEKLLPGPRLFAASTAPLRGFSNGYNRESYAWVSVLGVPGSIG